MRAVFEKAKVILDGEDAYLCVGIPYREAKKFVGTMKPKQYAVEIKEYRRKRSLDANAYAWTLIGKLAAKLSLPKSPVTPDMVYREAVRDIGGNYEVIPVREDRIEAWEEIWSRGHIGRFTEDLGPCRSIPGYHNIRTYIGSSDYDTAQMSRLINVIVEECRSQGIETMQDEELKSLLESERR